MASIEAHNYRVDYWYEGDLIRQFVVAPNLIAALDELVPDGEWKDFVGYRVRQIRDMGVVVVSERLA